METVALEWISSVEVEPHDVVQFVQRLNNVPEDAVCEIGDIFSRRCRTIGFGNQDERRVRNEVHLSCEPRVAGFLCKKFWYDCGFCRPSKELTILTVPLTSKKIQHVTGGEVIQVRCKHVYPGAKCLGKITSRTMKPTSECVEDADQTTLESETQAKSSNSAAAVLPIDKVIALIDLLGDQVVDAQETYELFADSDASGPQRMTMLGHTKALSKLCKNGWTAKSSRVRGNRNISAEGDIKITVESLRHLLSRLIASNNVAVKRIPAATTVPFLSYTDFLAVYVAFLANHHSSS